VHNFGLTIFFGNAINSNTAKNASHVGPMEYYMENQGGGVKEWKNEFACDELGTVA
jgi:hypothetical protein